MIALVRVIRLVHILLPVPYTPRVALYIHMSATSIAWMVDIVAELGLIRARTGATPCVR